MFRDFVLIDRKEECIYIDRTIVEQEWYPSDTFIFFMHLLLTADWETGEGQAPIPHLSAETGFSEKEVETMLDELVNANEIEVKKKRVAIKGVPVDKFTGKLFAEITPTTITIKGIKDIKEV